jgi:hypothetical protein
MHLAARFRGGCDRGVAMLILTRRVGETLMIGDAGDLPERLKALPC